MNRRVILRLKSYSLTKMIIDILFLAAAGYGFYLGFKDGIINSVFSVLSLVVALMSAFKFSPYMTKALEQGFDMYNPLMFVVGFIVTFFVSMWLLRMVGSAISGGLELVNLDLPNQIIGGFVLAIFFSFLYSVLIWFADGARMIEEPTKTTSMSYRYLEPLRKGSFAFLGSVKPIVQNFLSETDKVMNQIEDSRINRSESKADIYDIENPLNSPSQNPNGATSIDNSPK
ncbi:MAG: CvpA family protein [Saprospiraceae bacterium]|nr:CvpA family protein [Saprospiraceae bacterium]